MISRKKWHLKQALGLVVGGLIGILILQLFDPWNSESELEWFERPLEQGVDVSYAGKYAQHPRVQELLATAGQLRLDALAQVRERAGIGIKAPERLVLSFRDASPGFLHKAVSRAVRSPQGYLQLTEVGLERFVTGALQLEKTLVHEFTHSTMRQAMERDYSRLPRWFREGAATWTAGQLEFKTKSVLAHAVYYGSDPLNSLDGLNTEKSPEVSYLDEGYFFDLLEQEVGPDGVKKIIARVVSGEGFESVLEDVTRTPMHELTVRSREFAKDHVNALLEAAGVNEVRAAIKLERADDRASAISALRRFLLDRPDSFLAPVARLRLAGCLERIGEPKEAIEVVDGIALPTPLYPWLATQLSYRRASCLRDDKHYEDAARIFKRITEDNLWEGEKRIGVITLELADALAGAGKPREALAAVERSLPFLQGVSRNRALEIKADTQGHLDSESPTKQ